MTRFLLRRSAQMIPLLIGIMRGLENARVIVFINTKREADRVWGFLEGNGYPSAILSGDVPQKKRLALLKRFSNGEVSVLVATDVAARGLHIEGVTHVINYNLPDDLEVYIHRSGRTGRASAKALLENGTARRATTAVRWSIASLPTAFR